GGRGDPGIEGAPVLINGREIEPEAIGREMQNHASSNPAESWREAARALVVRELLLAEARRRGVSPEPETLDEAGAESEEERLIRALLDEAVELSEPSEAELRRVYEGMKARFVTPTLFEAAHILIEPPSEDTGGWAEAQAEARLLIEMVGDDAKAFAEAAVRSDCPTGAQGGSLGQIRRGELAPPVQAALEALAEGSTAREPIRSRFGWHVVRLARRIEGRELPYEIVADKIRDLLEARAWSIGAAQYVAQLASQAQIEGVEITPPDAGFASCEEGKGC
ncbi:MAG TPA: peptidylprolyl isomerase, partial [Phenylobacterium sp.]